MSVGLPQLVSVLLYSDLEKRNQHPFSNVCFSQNSEIHSNWTLISHAHECTHHCSQETGALNASDLSHVTRELERNRFLKKKKIQDWNHKGGGYSRGPENEPLKSLSAGSMTDRGPQLLCPDVQHVFMCGHFSLGLLPARGRVQKEY